MGLTNYYRAFVENYARISAPLRKLLVKDAPVDITPLWTEDCQDAVDRLKQKLTEAPILAYPDWTKAFTLRTDASLEGLGAVLMQDGKTIAYLSRALSPAEKRYDTRELECLAVIYAAENLKPYLQNNRAFVVQSDHANLKWLMNVRHDSGRLARWALRLSEFQFHVEHIPGTQNTVADGLSRVPLPNTAEEPTSKWTPLVCACHLDTSRPHPRVTPIRWVSHTIDPIPPRRELIRLQRADAFCAPLIDWLQSKGEGEEDKGPPP